MLEPHKSDFRRVLGSDTFITRPGRFDFLLNGQCCGKTRVKAVRTYKEKCTYCNQVVEFTSTDTYELCTVCNHVVDISTGFQP